MGALRTGMPYTALSFELILKAAISHGLLL